MNDSVSHSLPIRQQSSLLFCQLLRTPMFLALASTAFLEHAYTTRYYWAAALCCDGAFRQNAFCGEILDYRLRWDPTIQAPTAVVHRDDIMVTRAKDR